MFVLFQNSMLLQLLPMNYIVGALAGITVPGLDLKLVCATAHRDQVNVPFRRQSMRCTVIIIPVREYRAFLILEVRLWDCDCLRISIEISRVSHIDQPIGWIGGCISYA